jgi:hypothetical protein
MGITLNWKLVFGLTAIFFLSSFASADEAMPAETLNKLKAATVFIKVEAGKERASGSGFVIRTEDRTVHVVTNNHVIDLTPEGQPQAVLKPTIAVVFNSGGKNEQSVRGEVVAADPRYDLAIIKVVEVANPPVPIELGESAKLMETMPVFILGFPLGGYLATNKGNPAITVGKGSVASLRNDEHGELTMVQVDGDITPGNSGGPVVDNQGRLVGVAAATIRNRRIGFAIPTAKLTQSLKGRLLDYQFIARPATDKLEVRVELGVFDPFNKLKGISFYYLPGGKPADKKLAGLPGVQQVKLERTPQQLVGNFTLKLAGMGDPKVTFQAVYADSDSDTFVTNSQERSLPRAGGSVPPPSAVARVGSNPSPPPSDPIVQAVPNPSPPAEPRGKTTIDLMSLIDPTKDVVHGKWEVKDKTLLCTEKDDVQRIEIPYHPPEEYDLVVVFSQPKMNGGVALVLPNPKGGSLWWEIGAFTGRSYHLGLDKTYPTMVQPRFLKDNTAYNTTVQVRRDSIRCLLDGKELVNHKTNFSDLAKAGRFELRDATVPGVVCSDPTVFHYLKLVEVTGKGSKIP